MVLKTWCILIYCDHRNALFDSIIDVDVFHVAAFLVDDLVHECPVYMHLSHFVCVVGD